MNGKIFSIDLSYACSLAPASDSDSGCAKVLFDIFKNNLKYKQSSFKALRYGRTGMSFLICGIYLWIISIRLAI